jgi:hypothetical protein
LEGENGKVRAEVAQFTRYSLDLPCVYYRGLVDHRQLSIELMSDEEREARKKEAKSSRTGRRHVPILGKSAGASRGWVSYAARRSTRFEDPIGAEGPGIAQCEHTHD